MNIREFTQNEGVFIGLITAVLKLLIQVRQGKWNPKIFITDTIAAIIIGYCAWEVVQGLDISLWVKVVFTSFLSGNAFVLVSILYNPDLAKQIFFALLGKTLDIEIRENGKK